MAASSRFSGMLSSLAALVCWLCVLQTNKGCHARSSPLLSSQSVNKYRLTPPKMTKAPPLRGGGAESSHPFGFGRRATTTTTTNKRGPISSSSSQQQQQQQPQNVFGSKMADQDPTPEEKIATKEMLNSFLTRDSRNTFIARVYAILAGQLVVTALSVMLFGTQPALRRWTLGGGGGATVPIISLLISTISWAVMCASSDARRKAPLKWWLLGFFTLGEAISVGFISSFYMYKSVISAMLATALATTGVSCYTIFNKNQKYDLTQWGAGLSSCALIFLVYGVIGLLQVAGIIPTNFLPYNDALYSFVGAVLFSFYLAYHTKLIVAGKHAKYQMNEKDYVFGAMTLYNDIINMFIYILRIIGEDRDR